MLWNKMDHWRNQRKNKKVSRDEGKQKHNDLKPMRHSKSSSKGAVDSDTALPHKQEKSQMKNLNLLLKKLKKKNKVQS